MAEAIDKYPAPDTAQFRRSRSAFIYSLIRRIHLYCGLVLIASITMYFVTGIAIVHASWFGKDPAPIEVKTSGKLDPGLNPQDPAFPSQLAARFHIPGQYHDAQAKGPNRWQLNYNQPGSTTTVNIEPDRSFSIIQRKLGFRQTLIGFHRTHGYEGGWFFVLWALIMDLVNVSLILFAITGTYMWWKLSKHRTLGWITLLASYGYAAAIVAMLWLGR
jgi:hypothetical protein